MAKERNKAKKEQQATERAEARRKRQRSALIWRSAGILAAVVAASSAGYCIITERQLTSAMTTASYPAGIHVGNKIVYKESPPVGGPHNVVWQNCGIYDVPIHNEHAVHALEHGAVWITYRPDLPADQIQELKTLASDDYMLLSPYPGLRTPIVVSSWNHQVALERADDRKLRQFIGAFKNNASTTPEFGAPCSGGTSATAEANSLDTGSGPMTR